MMDITNEVIALLGQQEGETIEYKSVLPPSKNIAQLISAFANARGGYIILGVNDSLEIVGLSDDFRTNPIVYKALDLLSTRPNVHYQYVMHQGKNLYVIKVEKSDVLISVEGRIYERVGPSVVAARPEHIAIFKSSGYVKIKEINTILENYKKDATNANIKFLEHYQSVLKLFDDLSILLYPKNVTIPTDNQEGKILLRILFSSLADNFETYLSDILYEIYITNRETLKSESPVTVREVLNCEDIEDFVKWYAKKKVGNLQKGSVKGFLHGKSGSSNLEEKTQNPIKELKVIDEQITENIESLLQIRHLYSHRNGIIDEKFLKYFKGQFQLHKEHCMSINEVCDKLGFLAECVHKIDERAIVKYKLSVVTSP
jgi:hypothetical protein